MLLHIYIFIYIYIYIYIYIHNRIIQVPSIHFLLRLRAEPALQSSVAPIPGSIVRVPLLSTINQISFNRLYVTVLFEIAHILLYFQCTLTLRPHIAICYHLGLRLLLQRLAHGRFEFLSLNVTILIQLPKAARNTSMEVILALFHHLTTIADQVIILQIKGRTYALGTNLFR